MIEFTIYWPIQRDSSREFHNYRVWETWEDNLLRLAGGFTIAGECKGYWRNDSGKIVEDTCRVYRVALESARESALFDLVRRYRPMFDQQCVYVAVTSENAMLVS